MLNCGFYSRRADTDMALELNAAPPVSVWNKPLALDAKAFSQALAKAIGHGLLGKFEDLADDGVDAMEALGLRGNEPEVLLFLLVQQALKLALADLLRDSESHLPPTLDQHTGDFVTTLQQHFTQICISRDFFEHPQNLPLLQTIQQALVAWLVAHDTEAAVAETLAARLPGYFPFALHREWRKHGERYAPIKAALDTPFAKASEREQAWRTYQAYLQQRIEEGAFGEAFGLKQIYIPLNGYREEKSDSELEKMEPRQPNKRMVLGLAEELTTWLHQSNKDDAVRVLSGGPGSGKSSFAKMFAARVSAEGRLKVLFVPLHLIDPTGDFVEAFGRYVRNEGIFSHNPLHPESAETNLLLILDGLDELANQGQAAALTARDFVNAVQNFVYLRNSSTLNLRVLFSGREVVIQDTRTEFRKPQQILHVLPYYTSETDRNVKAWMDPDQRLQRDLRQDWWQNYGRLTGKPFNGMPQELDRDDLQEVNAQPLLNYLLAISYCRDELDFSKDINLNQIYYSLVKAVHERGYEGREGRRHAGVRHMELNDFFLMLEEVAMAAWHGDGRSTTIKEIEQHCRDAGYDKQLEDFRVGAERGITRLLAAFFFRQHGERQRGDPTFVFTHKSFGEYLAARRLVRAMKDIVEERDRRDNKGGGKGWSEADALERWARLCGPTAVSGFLHRFWLAEVALRPIEDVTLWQQHFVRLFSHMLRHGSPMERLQLPTFSDMLFQSRNAEEALLAAMNACARVTKIVSKIDHPEPTTFGAWIRRVQGQRKGRENILTMSCLTFIDLEGVILRNLDLYMADLSDSNLMFISAHSAILAHADLSRADLREANLIWVNLFEADLIKANLSQANLSGSKLAEADLSGAEFSQANLSGADLNGVNLIEAKLSGVDLSRANLDWADLNRADLSGADLSEANLHEANLSGTNFSRANLREADLSEAELSGADLSGANLREAIFSGADLIGADLRGAKFDPKQLREANTTDAIFDESK